MYYFRTLEQMTTNTPIINSLLCKRECIKNSMNINELAEAVHKTAVEKGFWRTERRFPEYLTLMHSELSEAYEAWRDGLPAVPPEGQDGWAIELVDCMIVILDVLAAHNVDIEGLLRKKHAINSQRPYQHGRTI